MGFPFQDGSSIDDDVVALAQLAADLGAQALERSSLYEHERRLREAMDRISRLAPRFGSESPEAVAAAICREARETFVIRHRTALDDGLDLVRGPVARSRDRGAPTRDTRHALRLPGAGGGARGHRADVHQRLAQRDPRGRARPRAHVRHPFVAEDSHRRCGRDDPRPGVAVDARDQLHPPSRPSSSLAGSETRPGSRWSTRSVGWPSEPHSATPRRHGACSTSRAR